MSGAVPACASASDLEAERARAPWQPAVKVDFDHWADGLPPEALTDEVLADACLRLWAEVLAANFKAALNNRLEPDERRAPGLAVKDARRWFGTRDFFMVCALCNLDGVAVLDAYHRKLAAGERFERFEKAVGLPGAGASKPDAKKPDGKKAQALEQAATPEDDYARLYGRVS